MLSHVVAVTISGGGTGVLGWSRFEAGSVVRCTLDERVLVSDCLVGGREALHIDRVIRPEAKEHVLVGRQQSRWHLKHEHTR